MSFGWPRLVRVALALAWLAPAACDRGVAEPPAGAADAGAAPPASGLLHLDETSVARAGLELVAAAPASVEPEVDAYGRVLDSAPLGEAVAMRAAARGAQEAAARELRRVELLAGDRQNASARDLEAARAAEARARADGDVAEARVAALWGPARDSAGDLQELARQLARREVGLLRIDVPGGGARPAPEQGAHFRAYPDEGRELAVRLLGPAPDSDPMLPGWSFLFLVTDAPPPVGAPVHGRVRAEGTARSGVRVPETSVLRDGGRLLVFVERGARSFERRSVAAEARSDGTWFVSSGLAAGERVVAAGAQQLLSTEILSASGAEEDD